jgi:hypothetical protein
MATTSPFKPRSRLEKRLKLLVYGEAGAGKTRFALSLPRLAMIDTESGTDHYDGEYALARLQDPGDIRRAIDWLAREKHGFASLAIDSFSLVWDALQKKWSEIFLARLEDRRGHKHEFYELGPREWQTIKADHKDLVARLLAIDLNVVITCRSKPEYEGGGELMRRTGTTFDGEKGLAHAFDVVLELWRSKGVTEARAVKDRTGKLPAEPFELTGDFLRRTYPGVLEREARPLEPASAEQRARLDGLVRDLGVGVEVVERRARELGFPGLEGLSAEEALELSGLLERALEKRSRKEETIHALP